MDRCGQYEVRIIVATHKKYPMPSDSVYLPLHVGAAKAVHDLGYLRDDSGDHISGKNPGFCELTGLYWAWKNLDADYIGLVHYRRYFRVGKRLLGCGELESLLAQYKVIVPKKRHYFVESLYSHYAHTLYIEHLDLAAQILRERHPEYAEVYERTVRRSYGYMFNMFLLRRDYLNDYCTWLFDILFELEKRVDISGLSEFHARFYGRVSEILFNVWLEQQISVGRLSRSDIKELDYICTEKVNWVKKGRAFLAAKFFGKKYEGSF